MNDLISHLQSELGTVSAVFLWQSEEYSWHMLETIYFYLPNKYTPRAEWL